MRVLFLLLLLTNVLFLAWTRWVVPPGPGVRETEPVPTTPLRPIRLQQEAQGASGVTSGGDGAAAGVAIAAAPCVSVGPFLEQAQADAAAASLQRLGFTARLRSATDEVRVGHWVRVPDLATLDDAANAIGVLRAAGLADTHVLVDEALGTVVSVGVFADVRRAEEAAAAVTRTGFTARTSERMRTLDVFWLDVDRQANGGIPEVADVGAPPADGLPLELRVCPSVPLEVPAGEPATGSAGG